MISQVFKFGGGAGIGSYVIVMREGSLVKPDAEKIRLSYDNGDNLYLSILDDVTEEALLPLTGYVDNNNILHLSGRDFDDNKTYEFSINGEDHKIDSDIIDGITLGNGTIPTEGGGGSGSEVSGTNDGTNWTSLTIDGDTYAIPQGGSSVVVKEINETDITPELLQEVYNEVPEILRVNSVNDGIQDYELKVNNKSNNYINYTCIISGTEIELRLENREGTINFSTNQLNFMPSNLVNNLYSSQEVDTLLNNKQNTLISGTNIKTINNESLLGEGNINIQGGGGDVTDVEVNGVSVVGSDGVASVAVPTKISDLTNDSGFITGINSTDVVSALGYTPGTSNFSGDYDDLADKPDLSIYAESSSLAAVATSGDYDDLLNKPTIPAAQVNSDWDAVSGVAQILNKPSLAAVATSGAYSDLSGTPTIPTDTSDLTNGAGFITDSYHDSSKQDILVSGTNIKTINNESILGSGNIEIQGGGTNVVANPTLEGTESDLIGLEVAGTKYRVPQFEIQSNLKGKKISFIGDSITTYSGYLPSGNVTRYPRGAITNVNQTWWKQLIDQTGMVLGQNCAWDGSTCIGRSTSTTNAYGACSAKRISQLGLNGNPDIIICFIGINDWGATYNNTGTHYGSPFTNGAFVPVGSYTGETTAPSGDLQTFSEAYGSMIYNIQVKYPNAKIYCCTLLQTNGKSVYNYDADGVFPSINRDGVTLAAYNERIRTLAKNIGAEVIDFAKCGINWGNISTYLEDGLHPNVAGMKLLCASAKAKLEADFGYTTESFTPLQTFSVTNNLTNVTNSNNSTTASESTTYSASLTADAGYTISSVTITMGGTDITSSAYSGGAINIGNVTGNIVITASATLNVYSITNSLTNVTNSNQATSINHGNSYSATLTIPSGYNMQSVSIQMGGVDITSSVYSDNNISISSVTGNIIITAVATDQVTYSITNNLSNVTNSNASVSIIQGDSYSATLTPSTHYELQTANVSILMGGTDVTGTVYDGSNRTISIPNVTGTLVINATATIITHTVTNTLTHTTNSNNAVSANDGSSYSGTLTADTGYNISSVSVTMGGVDITSTAYNNGVITISSVTGDIVIQCVSTAVVYSITNNLTNATSNNPASTVNYGSSYSATITADAGYEISSASVTMGGVDITNTVYDDGVISIASVTGDLVITVTAVDPTVITWYTNFPQTSTSSFVASSRGWALDETTYADIYNKPINRISLVATASSGSIDICVAPSYGAQSGFTQQQTINWTSANKVGNIVTLELPTPITLATGEYLCVYVNSVPATGAACYASGGSAGQFYSYVGASGHSTWGSKGTYSIQFNIGYKA